jgi:hypothetical protein
MGSVPTDTDPVATAFNTFLNILITGGDAAAEAFLTGLDPGLLGAPIISAILDFGVAEFGKYLYNFLATMGTNLIIDIQTNGEESKVVSAGTALQLAEGSNNVQAIQQATQAMVAAWGSLIHYDGSASP